MSNQNSMKITTPTDCNIVVTRSFNAPLQLVSSAMSQPELIRKWLFGPPGWEMTVCEEDARVGGTFHWAWKGPNGEAMSMRGDYKEIVPFTDGAKETRCVRTERFEFGCANQMGEQLCTMKLSADGDRTHMHLTIVYPSKEARDGALASGMEHGMAAGYDRLEEMLAK